MLTKRGEGLSRREFVQIAGGTLAALGMSGALTPKLARALEKAAAGRPKVVWLHFASDTGCTESLIKTDYPSTAELVLDILSIDYHESIMAAAGKQADELLAKAAPLLKSGGTLVYAVCSLQPEEGAPRLAAALARGYAAAGAAAISPDSS